MSTARRDLHISDTLSKPESETSEPLRSRISQEVSAKEMIKSSSRSFLLLAIAAIDICFTWIIRISFVSNYIVLKRLFKSIICPIIQMRARKHTKRTKSKPWCRQERSQRYQINKERFLLNATQQHQDTSWQETEVLVSTQTSSLWSKQNQQIYIYIYVSCP